MEAVLHVEPITRSTPAPLSIGYSDYLFFGERVDDDDENLGHTASNIRLGCPLVADDLGSTRTSIPLVKTFEYAPDPSRKKGNVYSETTHFFLDQKYLIPFRSKICSGLGQGLRLTHVPGLNEIRRHVTGMSEPVCDARADIVTDLLQRDQRFSQTRNRPLYDWISEDLSPNLSKLTTSNLSFDTGQTSRMIHRYMDQVHRTSNDLTQRHVRDISSILTPEVALTPVHFSSADPIIRPLQQFRNHLIPHSLDLKSFGTIPLADLDKVDYNPFQFQAVCDLLDSIPLTDFNLDLIVSTDCTIELFHINVGVNRIAQFRDSDLGLYHPKSILEDYLSEGVMEDIIRRFYHYHSNMTDELRDELRSKSVKLKIVKTITDEAIILLYRSNSTSHEPPLCGVYFDIALQSLAPMTIVPEVAIDSIPSGNQYSSDAILPYWNYR